MTRIQIRRWLLVVLILTFILGGWWIGQRVTYFAWAKTHGMALGRQTDFAHLARVLPPPDATITAIYRGLPHQYWEPGQLLLQLFLTRHRAIGGWRFHTTPVPASAALKASITEAMQSPALYQPYRGPKMCGGYHPDYCLEWQSTRGTYYALLCTGCHEVILIGDGAEVHCDLHDEPLQTLTAQLKELQ